MNASDRRTGNVNRQTAAGMGLCISGMGVLAWLIAGQFFGGGGEPALLFIALPVLISLGLIVGGFAMMVSGAEPFEDDGGGVRETDEE